MNTIYFWRVSEKPYGIFSQWYQVTGKTQFVGDDAIYSIPNVDNFVKKTQFLTRETFMMFCKAVLFIDGQTDDIKQQNLIVAEAILKEQNPRKIKSLGRKVAGFNQKIWDQYKYKIVVNGNYLQFNQIDSMKKLLVDTDNRQIAEASPYDKIWGIGLNPTQAQSGVKWCGKNLLGKALMEVREKLTEK